MAVIPSAKLTNANSGGAIWSHSLSEEFSGPNVDSHSRLFQSSRSVIKWKHLFLASEALK